MKYFFMKKASDYDKAELTYATEESGIVEILEDFKLFLLACGFHPANVEKIKYDEKDYE